MKKTVPKLRKRFFPALCWENPYFMVEQTLFSQLLELNAGQIFALHWANFCLAPEFTSHVYSAVSIQLFKTQPEDGVKNEIEP